jgi:hypothetical protein
MLNRRDFLAATGSAVLVPKVVSGEKTQTLPTSANAPHPMLALTEQLMYSTVKLLNQERTRWGTGFLFSLFRQGDNHVPVVVTNRHVVEALGDECVFSLTSKMPDGSPDLQNHVQIEVTDFKHSWIPHPDVDLAMFPIAKALDEIGRKGHPAFAVTLNESLIPTEDQFKALLPVEQILTVGFPGGLWDNVHNLPVFHRGYTATAPYINFQGRREFLIDITTWFGSSGSPVLLFNDGPWQDRNGVINEGGVRIKLIGIICAVAVEDVSGNVRIEKEPTEGYARGNLSVPINLGVCINASRILEFEPIFVGGGYQPPAGYKMRAQ